MGFLAPSFLALAALAGVPILVHFLRRRIRRTVDFPAVRYLQRMERERSRDRMLRNRLLLLVRVLIVLAVALAAARPTARLSGSGHTPIAVAVVLDNSASTGAVALGRRQLDFLKEGVSELLGTLTVSDRVWLITSDGHVTGGSPEAVRDALEAVEPTGGTGDIAAAVRRGLGLVQGALPRTGVVAVAFDGAASALPPDSLAPVENGKVPIAILEPEVALSTNRAVISALPEPSRWAPSGALTLEFLAPDSVDYSVELDGRTVHRGTAAGGDAEMPAGIQIRLSSLGAGWVRGKVVIEPDDFRADDERHFAVRVSPPPRVIVDGSAGEFLAAAVSTLVDERRLRGNGTAPLAGSPRASSFSGAPSMQEAPGAGGSDDPIHVTGADGGLVRLPAFIVAPSDPVHAGAANRALAQAGIPWQFGAISHEAVTARVTAGSDTVDSPIYAAFSGARVLLRYPLQYVPTGDAHVLPDTLVTAGGTPWVVSGPGYTIVGSPIEPDATDLPLRAGFVPWLLKAISEQLAGEGEITYVASGASLGRVAADSIEAPDGTVSAWYGDAATAPQLPGVYFLKRGALRHGALVVNIDARESDLRAADSILIRSRFSGSVTLLTAGSAWVDEVLAAALGRSLVIPLLFVALILVVLESVLARAATGNTTGSASGFSRITSVTSHPGGHS